jgi:hypothetical protein
VYGVSLNHHISTGIRHIDYIRRLSSNVLILIKWRNKKMGTNSTTKIYEDGKLMLALYKQFDGYPDGWGLELKEFIRSKKWVNGISGDASKVFNGAGCFALQLVCAFKKQAGDIYATTEDDKQEYNYTIDISADEKSDDNKKILISCDEEESYNEVLHTKEWRGIIR